MSFDLRIKKAMGPSASLKDLDVLQNMVSEDPTLALKVLPVIRYHLRPDKLESLPHPAPPTSTMLFAEPAMFLLTHCVEEISAPPQCSQNVASQFASSVEDHWRDLWASCLFLLKTCVDVPAEAPCDGYCACVHNELVYSNTIYMLLALARHPRLRSALTSTEDMLHVLSSVWLRERKGITTSVSLLLSLILARDTPLDPQPQSFVIPCAFEDLSTACLKRIKPIKSKRPANVLYEVLYHDMVVLIASTIPNNLHGLCINKKSVKKAASLLRSLPLDALLTNVQAQNLYIVIVSYLVRCIYRTGISCVAQALKERVVVVLFDVVHCLGGKIADIEEVSAQLLNSITPFFIHRQVLRDAKRSMEIVVDTGRWGPHSRSTHMLANSTSDAPETRFSNAANSFDKYMRDRMAMKVAYESMGYTIGCSNPTHTRDSKKEDALQKLMCCGICHFNLYCSPLCQKAHWSNGHKKECAQLRDQNKDGRVSERMTKQDIHFFAHMSYRDLKTYSELLKQKRAAYMTTSPATDPNTLHIKIDYRVHPVAFDVVVAEDSFKAYLAGVVDEGPGVLPVQAFFPLLEQPIELNHTIKLDQLEVPPLNLSFDEQFLITRMCTQ